MRKTVKNGADDRLRQIFHEEAQEILSELESALLGLNENRTDAEVVAKIFRCMHTLKGSGAMAGFDQLAAFAHQLENAFDAVRSGKLQVTSELVDLTLSAIDRIHAMLDKEDEPSSANNGELILSRLSEMQAGSSLPVVVAPSEIEAVRAEHGSESAESPRTWRIRFAPGPELFLNGTNPLLLFRELRQMGKMSIQATIANMPPLADMQPERCYTVWEINLTTTAGLNAIRDVFIFVEGECELSVEPVTPRPAAHPKGICEPDLTAAGLSEKRGAEGGRRSYDKPENVNSLRVSAAKLDQLVDLAGQLVTVQARLSAIAASHEDADISSVSEEIERLSASLREHSMNLRMVPIRGTFEKFRRLVHDLARSLGKDVELSFEGAETELDKSVIDRLSDPLMHLIRNGMDHGIEPPEERIAHGKPAKATIQLSALHAGANVLVAVSDDGRGIDTEAVRARAIEKRLIAPEAKLSQEEIFSLIFHPGFSTAKQVTDLSGRGVGMDVVRQSVESLRGSVEVNSEAGKSTSITLRLPLTMAIIDGLLVRVAASCFVLPLASTLECIELTARDVARANGRHVVFVRGQMIPYISLRERFSIGLARPPIEQVMLVDTAAGRFGFAVDEVLGNHQTVIKNLGLLYRHVQEISGATILGDGSVALIVDPERLVHEALRDGSKGFKGSVPVCESNCSREETAVCT